jgi:repressor LexA
LLKARGESMIDAGINSGDRLICQKQSTANNGDIVVALLDDSATVKRFFKKNDHVVLHPENDDYTDIIVRNVQILGKVVGLYRTIS